MEDFAVNQLALNQGGKPERRRAIAKYPRDWQNRYYWYIYIYSIYNYEGYTESISKFRTLCRSLVQILMCQLMSIAHSGLISIISYHASCCSPCLQVAEQLMHSTKQMQCTHTSSDWMATEWHHVSAVFDFLKGKQRMRSDHQLDAPTGADGCVGPEHQGLSRKAESWLLGKRVSFFRRFRRKSTLNILATSCHKQPGPPKGWQLDVKSVRVIMILAQASSVAKCDHVWSQTVGKQLPGSLLHASSVAHLAAGRWRCWPIHDCPKVDGGCMVSMLSMVAMCSPTLQ
jgi:hypothetical protein